MPENNREGGTVSVQLVCRPQAVTQQLILNGPFKIATESRTLTGPTFASAFVEWDFAVRDFFSGGVIRSHKERRLSVVRLS